MTFQPPPAPFLQWHCCSSTTERFQFPSQPHPFFETTKEVEELYKSTYSRRTKHLATELTPKETPNTPSIRILNCTRLKITMRRCSKSFLQYQMGLAINSQAQVTTIFRDKYEKQIPFSGFFWLVFVLGCWLFLFFESLLPTSNLQKAANWADLIWQQPRKNSLRRK